MSLSQQCVCNKPGGFRKPNHIVLSQGDDETISFSASSGEYLTALVRTRFFFTLLGPHNMHTIVLKDLDEKLSETSEFIFNKYCIFQKMKRKVLC